MLKINLVSHKNYGGQRLEKLTRALATMERVINSDAFADGVRNFTTRGKKTFSFKKNLFKDFEHYTNEEVLGMIMQAQEEEGNVADGQIDLYLELVEGDSGSSAVGYGYPGDPVIYTYSGWYDQQDIPSLANHITHEWCHKIGFDHAFHAWQDRDRDNSVPYGIGNLVEELANAS